MKTTYSFRGLYAITAGEQGQKLIDNVQAALQGGARVVQYRDKTTDQARRFAEAQALNDLCQLHKVPFIVNDDLELALAVKATGVHLGQEDGDAQTARKIAGEHFIIGVTCHDSIQLAKTAVLADASYVAFGACFPSSTKPTAAPASLTTITQARQQIALPIVAIGGITLNNATSVIAAGADMMCVISDLFHAANITERAREYVKLFP